MAAPEPTPPEAPLIDVVVSEVLDAPPAEAARRYCDFHTLHLWHPSVLGSLVEGEGIGAVRTLDLGGSAVRERLDARAEDGRGYAYRVLSHPLLGAGAHGQLAVRPGPDARSSVLEWRVSFAPRGPLPEAALVAIVRGLLTIGLKAAKHPPEVRHDVRDGFDGSSLETVEIAWADDDATLRDFRLPDADD